MAEAVLSHPTKFDSLPPHQGEPKKDNPLQLELSLIRNEYNTPPSVEFVPLTPQFKNEEKNRYFGNVEGILNRDFEYLAVTSGMEVASLRVDFLKELSNRLLGADTQQLQLAIQTRGLDKNAFTYPDGTIVVTQALLNEVNSVDELAALVGHEIGHLVLETSFRSTTAEKSLTPGIEWIHEEGCDAYGMKLSEEAGFNSLAFSNIIQRVSGHGRGASHQTGQARASYSYGGHMVIDSKTSDVPETPIDPKLKDSLQRTNIELTLELWDKLQSSDVPEVLAKLHPRDLLTTILNHRKKYVTSAKDITRSAEIYESIKQLLSDRVIASGGNASDVVLLLAAVSEHQIKYKNIMPTVDSVSNMADILPTLSSDWQRKTTDTYFKTPYSGNDDKGQTFLNYLKEHYYNQDLEQRPDGMPINEAVFLKYMSSCTKISGLHYGSYNDARTELSLDLLQDYSTKYIETDPALQLPDAKLSAIRDFLIKAKSQRIFVNADKLRKQLAQAEPNSDKENLLKVYFEVFDIPLKKSGVKEVIDTYLEEIKTSNQKLKLPDLFSYISEALRDYPPSQTERLDYANYVLEKLSPSFWGTNYSVASYLNGNEIKYDNFYRPGQEVSSEEKAFNLSVQKFSYGLTIAKRLFNEDSSEFYDFFNKITTDSGLDFTTLNYTQLLNLAVSLVSSEQHNGDTSVFEQNNITSIGDTRFKILHYEKLQQHPLLQRLAKESQQTLSAQTIPELKQHIIDLMAPIHFSVYGKKPTYNNYNTNEYNIFSDKALDLYINEPLVKNFRSIIEKGVPPTEFDELYNFVSHFFPNNHQRTELLRNINLFYLKSTDINFDNKVQYFMDNSQRVGPEGLVLLADQIDNIKQWREFKTTLGPHLDQYLSGSTELTGIATVDYATSKFIEKGQSVFETCVDDVYTKKDQSTELARNWMYNAINGITSYQANPEIIQFDQASQTFILNDVARSSFRSVKDIFDGIHDLTPLQRLVLVHKALTDERGALTSDIARNQLSYQVVKALDLPSGLVKEAIIQACQQVDAKLIALPIANMLGPMVGRSLSMDAVDQKVIGEIYLSRSTGGQVQDLLSPDAINRILDSPTQQISQFGLGYHTDQDSPLFLLSSNSDRIYDQSLESLGNIVAAASPSTPEKTTLKSSESSLNAGIEATINGVEASGALGIRALQLAVQFFPFPPETHKRLSDAFDSVPALNKLFFWENIDRLAKDSPETEALLQRTTIQECLGGGSLQTTYRALITQPDGSEIAGTMKIKNPNVAARLKDSYTAAKAVLDNVAEGSSDDKVKAQAHMGSMLIDLSQNWCLADINDKTFEADDDAFRETIEKYNQKAGYDTIYAPERIFTSTKLTSEEVVPGRTVNQILNDPTIDNEIKKDLVWTMSEFFLYQLKEPLKTASGENQYLIHSDPHVGNMIAEIGGEDIKIGVIDRSLFLKLDEKEAGIIRKMVDGNNISDFAYSTIDYLLEHNNVKGVKKGATTAAVFGELASEFAKQFARGSVNKITLLNTLFMELTKRQGESFDIPLNFRLMIRNIGAFQELAKRHGLQLDEIASSTQYI